MARSTQKPKKPHRPSFQFYPEDWLSDINLKCCSLAARGLWIELMCWMHKGSPYGYLTAVWQNLHGGRSREDMTPATISRLVGATEAETIEALGELEQWGVLSKDENGIIYSRRMVADEEKRQAWKRWYSGTKGLIDRLQRITGRQVTEADVRKIFERQENRCPYCRKKLPKSISIDHKIPVSRSGGHLLKNLVFCHRRCNFEKRNKTDEEYQTYLKLKSKQNQARSPSPSPSPSPNIKEKNNPHPRSDGANDKKNGHHPDGVIFDRKSKVKDSDFKGEGIDKVLARLRDYEEEFGKPWCNAQWDAAVEWAFDNPSKEKKLWSRFLLTWFRNEAKRKRERANE